MKLYKYTVTAVWGRTFEFIDSNWPDSHKIFQLLIDNELIKDSPSPEKEYKIQRLDGPVPQTIYVYERLLIADLGTTTSNGRYICSITPSEIN